jgi:alpha-L-arabinofuranosidase
MFSPSRRRFMHQASIASLIAPAALLRTRSAFAQSPMAVDATTHIYVDSQRTIAELDRNMFGSFLEHLGRAIYDGIYDPGSARADTNGFRKDLLEEIRGMRVPIIRYPGGNFVSGYNWLDGVGPVENRPRQLDRAWNSMDSNHFGTNEFMAWCKAVGTLPLMGLNLGTGTPEQAADLLEYCNVAGGTRWSDLRRQHGVAEPHNVRNWCLGNEMDGPWQIGHMSATEYGLKAADAARQMRAVDPSVRLIACGSSGTGLPTYLDWDRQVLEECYDYVDALSLHLYVGNTPAETGGDSAKFLALNMNMDRQIAEAVAVCDYVRGHKHSPKKLWVSFDEWNVWYRARSGAALNGARQEAPHLLEEIYNLEDALLVGGMVNTLLRNADRVKIGCLAQLVNVIAPIMTNANGFYRQPIYYPYDWALQMAEGAVLNLLVQTPTYTVSNMNPVPYIDAAATASAQSGKSSLFLLNRDLVKARSVEIHWEKAPPNRLISAQVLTGNDLKASNSFDAPRRVEPRTLDKPITRGAKTTVELPPRAYAAIQWGS